MSRHKKHRPTLRSLYQWHRYLGLVVALVAVLLAITGVMLNHTEQLHLNERPVKQRWLLNWYGISPPEGQFFRTEKGWFSQWSDRLYFNDTELPLHSTDDIVGVVSLDEIIVAATAHSLLLLTKDGEVIERQDGMDGIPQGIYAVATDNKSELLLLTDDGITAGNVLEGNWHHFPGVNAAWSKNELPSPELVQQIALQHSAAELPLERVILDLHSGRLFGDMGVYVMDISAILLLFNAASGVLIWWRRKRARVEKEKHQT